MGQSVKAVLQLLLIVAVIGAIVAWNDDKPDIVTQCFRYGGSAAAIGIIYLLWKASSRKELLPDVLLRQCGSYFERNGLCFGFSTFVSNGVCWLNVFFQNRYERPCQGRIVLQPPIKSFGIRRLPLDAIDLDVDCEGGACAVWRIPWPIPAQLQGRKLACDVAGDASYPQGAGKLLRWREGLRAGSPGGTGRRAAATAGLLLVGVVSISSPAKAHLRLPSGVAETTPPGLTPVFELLYRPELPTGGFPVVLASPAPREQKGS